MTDTDDLFVVETLPKINSRYVNEVLSELKRLDPVAAEQLLAIKVPTNDKMRTHPTINFYDDSLTIFGILAGMTSNEEPDSEPKADPEKIIDFFNRLLVLDYEAIATLINQRVNVNQELADHPDFLVLANADQDGNPTNPRIGLLGILNALTGVHESGWGRIGAEFDEDANIHRFVVPVEARTVKETE